MSAERVSPVVMLVVACALFMEQMDSTILANALPAIAASLKEDPITLKLALTSYLVALAIFIPASGWVADRFGARRIFRLALAIYIAASIGCAWSHSLGAFVVWRFLQGFGGAMMVPVGRMVLVRSTSKDGLVRALALVTVPAMLGPVTGPLLGGFIVTYLDWHWIFYINVPIGLAGIVLATIYFPRDVEAPPPRFDGVGFVLAGLSLSGLMLAATTAGRTVVPPAVSLTFLAVGLIAGGLYVRHALARPDPVLDIRLVARPTVFANVIAGAFFRIGVGASAFLLPLMFQLGFGLDALKTGLLTFSGSLGALIMKLLADPILKCFGFRPVLTRNAFLAAALLGATVLLTPGTPHLAIYALLVSAGLSRSLQYTSFNAIAFSNLDRGLIGRVTALAMVAHQVAMSLGVALGALAVETVQRWSGHAEPAVSDFHTAFLAMALISALAGLLLIRLPRDAGADLTERRSG